MPFSKDTGSRRKFGDLSRYLRSLLEEKDSQLPIYQMPTITALRSQAGISEPRRLRSFGGEGFPTPDRPYAEDKAHRVRLVILSLAGYSVGRRFPNSTDTPPFHIPQYGIRSGISEPHCFRNTTELPCLARKVRLR